MILYTSLGTTFQIDEEDYSRINMHRWRVGKSGSAGYIVTSTYDFATGKRNSLLLHRLIMNAEKGQLIDHVNGDRKDNRKENLRLCTRAQNLYNSRARKSTFGLKGVTKANDKYLAQLTHQGKNIYLGVHNTPEEAHKAYCDAIAKYAGEFGRTQ